MLQGVMYCLRHGCHLLCTKLCSCAACSAKAWGLLHLPSHGLAPAGIPKATIHQLTCALHLAGSDHWHCAGRCT